MREIVAVGRIILKYISEDTEQKKQLAGFN
jgi:hypothetical protein